MSLCMCWYSFELSPLAPYASLLIECCHISVVCCHISQLCSWQETTLTTQDMPAPRKANLLLHLISLHALMHGTFCTARTARLSALHRMPR